LRPGCGRAQRTHLRRCRRWLRSIALATSLSPKRANRVLIRFGWWWKPDSRQGCPEGDHEMRNGLLFGLALALAAGTASASPIGARPDLDRLAGVYKHRAAPGFGQRAGSAGEDILEIVKLSDQRAYIRIHTEDGEHICGFHGVADLASDALVYISVRDDGSPC